MSRLATDALALALLITGTIAPAAAAPAEAKIGEMTLLYDTTEWAIGGTDDAFTLTCITESCQRVVLDVTVTADADGFCDKEEARKAAEALLTFADRHPSNIYHFEDFSVVLADSRNGPSLDAPTAVFACITREGAHLQIRVEARRRAAVRLHGLDRARAPAEGVLPASSAT